KRLERLSGPPARDAFRSAAAGPTLLQQVPFRLFCDEEQRRYTVARQSRFNQFTIVFDTQLKAKVVAPNHRGAIHLDVAEGPHVADMLKCGRAFPWTRWRPGGTTRARS